MSRHVKAPNWRLLVRLKDVSKEEVSTGGIVLATESDKEYRQQHMCEGYIVDVGPVAGKYTYWPDEPKQKYEKGMCIMIHRYAGVKMDDMGDGHVYRMVQDLDVQAIFPDESVEL